jgi:hypothetical protein
MASLTDIRKALADLIVDGIDSSKVNVKWYELGPDSTVPLDRISIMVDSVENTMTQGIAADAVLRVVVEVAGQSEETWSLRMDKFRDRASDECLFEVIEADRTLGGLVADLNPVRFENAGPTRAELEVQVMFA